MADDKPSRIKSSFPKPKTEPPKQSRVRINLTSKKP